MKLPHASLRHPFANRRGGFSLVEVTLAVGIVAFALTSLLGALPLALSSVRQSVDEGRAATIANTLFAALRDGSFSSTVQPAFTHVYYLDVQFDNATGKPLPAPDGTLNLATLGTAAAGQPPAATKCYAKFLAGATDPAVVADPLGSQRRLCLTSDQPLGGADYAVSIYFDNQPAGMLVMGQANRVEIVVSPLSQIKDQYRFVSTVCYRLN